MTDALDPETRRLVAIAVAGAPALTTEQIAELRRVLKPNQYAPVVKLPAKLAKPVRRAA